MTRDILFLDRASADIKAAHDFKIPFCISQQV